jgi:hypothetical protein
MVHCIHGILMPVGAGAMPTRPQEYLVQASSPSPAAIFAGMSFTIPSCIMRHAFTKARGIAKSTGCVTNVVSLHRKEMPHAVSCHPVAKRARQRPD